MNDRIKAVFDEGIVFATISQVRKDAADDCSKVQLRPFIKGSSILYQLTYQRKQQVFHENLTAQQAAETCGELLSRQFHQMAVQGVKNDYHITWYQKLKIKKTEGHQKAAPAEHNRRKNYILPEGEPCDFLIHLGVMAKNGEVLHAKYDKFRQINRYLELMAPCLDALDSKETLRIVDFGCGKAYLTFALYYHLTKQLGRRAEIIGLDLKADVVENCRKIAESFQYDGLRFEQGDIRGFTAEGDIDMVITLHACDTATDEAIVQAMSWNAKVILTVPCCQHELLDQIHNQSMDIMLKHGILKERFSSLLTDSIRCQLLEACGYNVQIMEFISLEHTPKNLMIKAVKAKGFRQEAYEKYLALKAQWGIHPYLEKRLLETGRLKV